MSQFPDGWVAHDPLHKTRNTAPGLAISRYGIRFNKAALAALGNPARVTFLYNRTTNQLAITPANPPTAGNRTTGDGVASLDRRGAERGFGVVFPAGQFPVVIDGNMAIANLS